MEKEQEMERNEQKQKNPWDGEPDELDFLTLVGLPAAVRRPNELKHLCGYVQVPVGHPFHGAGYDDCQPPCSVHGGLTYADPLRYKDGWWLGFDCGHAGDLSPGYLDHPHLSRLAHSGTYRTIAYVRQECEELALQIASHPPWLEGRTKEEILLIIQAAKTILKMERWSDARVLKRLLVGEER